MSVAPARRGCVLLHARACWGVEPPAMRARVLVCACVRPPTAAGTARRGGVVLQVVLKVVSAMGSLPRGGGEQLQARLQTGLQARLQAGPGRDLGRASEPRGSLRKQMVSPLVVSAPTAGTAPG